MLKRCAHSVLVDQLWYRSSTSRQLISSFTTAQIPPLSSSSSDRGALLSSDRWGPDNNTLVNIPLCMASAPAPRPKRIRQPPAVLPIEAPWPAQQIWAGPLSNGSFVVILWNLGEKAAKIDTSWAAIGIDAGRTCKVRDMWAHEMLADAKGVVSAVVPSHDVSSQAIPTTNRFPGTLLRACL